MESNRIIPKGILFPFVLLTTLFFAWAVPNNLTDTMLAAFKRIMSMMILKQLGYKWSAICWDMGVVLFPVLCSSRNILINPV